MRARLIAALLVLLFAVPAMAQTRGATSLRGGALAGEPFSRSVALVVGINDYNAGWRPLSKAVPDARAVGAALEEAGFEATVLENLDSIGLERAIKDFVYVQGADPNARLLFWFAGHGHMIGEEGYLVPADAPLPRATPASEAAFQSVALPLAAFSRYMAEVKARHVLAVFDSCFSGLVFGNNRASVPASVVKSAGMIARQFIASGSFREEALDDGAFREAFIAALLGREPRALRGDGHLTGSGLGAFLAETISSATAGRQNPIYATSNVVGLDRGDFVFPVAYAPRPGDAPAAVSVPSAIPGAGQEAPPELRIDRVGVRDDDPDAVFVADKLARNVVEYYSVNNLYVSSDLTGREPARPPTHRLAARVTPHGDELSVELELATADGRVEASASFKGRRGFLRDNYKLLPETVHYMLDVSMRTLRPLRSANRPTASGEAYMLFLAARQKASRRGFADAAGLLDEAIEVDDAFAAGHAARAEIGRLQREPQSVIDGHLAAALAIDPDYPPLSIFAREQMGDPVPALRTEAASADWSAVEPGLEYRRVESADFAVTVLAWRFDPQHLRLDVARAETSRGETAESFRRRLEARLAINAGFFDLDIQERLSPVGLLVVGGREIKPFDERKAVNPLTGVLYVKDGQVGVMPARQYVSSEGFDSALQTGPLVVDPGGRNGIYRNSFDRQNRSAVCIDFQGRPVVVQVSGGLSLYEFGELLSTREADGGFGCERAINLDGGPSSQVSFAAGELSVEAPGLWKVGSSLVLVDR